MCYFILCYLYLYGEEYYRREVCVKRCASLDLYALGYCWRIQRAASPQPSPLRGEGADGESSPAVSKGRGPHPSPLHCGERGQTERAPQQYFLEGRDIFDPFPEPFPGLP